MKILYIFKNSKELIFSKCCRSWEFEENEVGPVFLYTLFYWIRGEGGYPPLDTITILIHIFFVYSDWTFNWYTCTSSVNPVLHAARAMLESIFSHLSNNQQSFKINQWVTQSFKTFLCSVDKKIDIVFKLIIIYY